MCCHHQVGCRLENRLMVKTVNEDPFSLKDIAQPRLKVYLYLVSKEIAIEIIRRTVLNLAWTLVWKVGIEGAPQEHIYYLQTPADTKNRFVIINCLIKKCKF